MSSSKVNYSLSKEVLAFSIPSLEYSCNNSFALWRKRRFLIQCRFKEHWSKNHEIIKLHPVDTLTVLLYNLAFLKQGKTKKEKNRTRRTTDFLNTLFEKSFLNAQFMVLSVSRLRKSNIDSRESGMV